MMMQNLAAYFSSLSHAERKKLVENHAKEIATWVIKGDGYIIVGVKDNINFNTPELESAIDLCLLYKYGIARSSKNLGKHRLYYSMKLPAKKIEKIEKYYGNKLSLTKAIDNISFSVDKGEFIAIMGASGSGKTTLLNCISTIDKVSSGHIFLGNTDITKLKGNNLNKFRREKLGFIFQDFNLLDQFCLKDNILLPLVLAGVKPEQMEPKVYPLAKKLGIEELLEKYPYEISGGQKQRVAVARALITNPQLILADEPTGALDSKATDSILALFNQINEDGQTILMVTHHMEEVILADRIIVMDDGKINGIGTHEELLAKNEIYREVYESQTQGGGDFDENGGEA